jgi:hypothetical protein
MAIIPPWALHVGAANCFNRPTAIDMATTVSADDTAVTFTPLDGQVVTFSEYSTNATFTGTDTNNGGRAAGGRGRVTGIDIPYIANELNGTSTSSAQGILTWQGDIAQRAAQTLKLALKSRGTVTSDRSCDMAQSFALKNAGHTDRRQ